MQIANPSERISGICDALEILSVRTMSNSDKSGKISQDGLGQLQVSLKELTTLAGGGHGS